jgi:hypothetical protein
VGQQESVAAPEQEVTGTCSQTTLHRDASPVRRSRVQGSPSSAHTVGQVEGGSQVSPDPRWPSPQMGAQSWSAAAPQPAGQQPSPLTHAVTAVWLHPREHASTVPDATSLVQASPSSQVEAHAPGRPAVMPRSQRSVPLWTPSPQTVAQSVSVAIVHHVGQQPSPDVHDATGCATQAAVHEAIVPSSFTAVHASPAGHDDGQFASMAR